MTKLYASFAVATLLLTGHAGAQSFRDIPRDQCTEANGLKWVEADVFVSASTGKSRKQHAGCRVDRKAANAIIRERIKQ